MRARSEWDQGRRRKGVVHRRGRWNGNVEDSVSLESAGVDNVEAVAVLLVQPPVNNDVKERGKGRTSVKAISPESILSPGEKATFLAAPAGPLCDVFSSASLRGAEEEEMEVGEEAAEPVGRERMS
jgi:hypothetical protein